MRVCVVGAGAAGLCAARHLTTPGGGGGGNMDVVVYEQTDQLGGTWVYTEHTELDPSTGLPVHSSLYKSLRTNLPKEVMGFPDFPIPEQPRSYLPAIDILRFLDNYAEHFQLKQHIKFRHLIKQIQPNQSGWTVTVTNLTTKQDTVEDFDAIMVCNGHYHTPRYPDIPGADTFPGLRLHSHHYRVPAPLANKTVVVVGAGPSGLDIALEITAVAKQVILSHHLKDEILTKFPDNLVQKPDIQSVSGSCVTFVDGSQVQADVLFYCTGYRYSFPFLSPECGVTVEDNFVQPLYKHLVHIHRPTMCFIGLPYYVCAFTMFDVQARYFTKVLQGSLKLPSSLAMQEHTEAVVARCKADGLSPRQYHMLGPRQTEYFLSLTQEAGLQPVPPVMEALHSHSSRRFLEDLVHYREDVFRLLDDQRFQLIQI
ncbi:uncharacterized protein LOC128989586 isoform X2 [Macrosteles quadrilineatus]|uniref:uncharacterized protein LOC128989586 isoform X1 n=1 Tax=Macrosteles quadrilineatus TaxID=74068 RepID=UPI0023E0D9BB|nr:uncharacterized protein LOC128989586 isoform X1 [Macrosteles quadrilineatus]XP_054267478.1 uncharacterized protein LOC128989586 isoform X2 [Macrosteles quadrilineatus]